MNDWTLKDRKLASLLKDGSLRVLPDLLDLKQLAESRAELIKDLREQGILKSEIVAEAMEAIPREEFLWPGTPNFLAYADEPQGLGSSEQTISAPHMVAIMLEELSLISGLRILEVGGGSGYNAALLGWIVSRGVKKTTLVTTIERNEQLAIFEKSNIARAGLSEVVEVVNGDGSLGYPEAYDKELYDRIVVTAAAARIPELLKRQLKDHGFMLIPVGESSGQVLTKVRKIKNSDGKITYPEAKLMGCIFVPLVSDNTRRAATTQ